ATIFNTYTSKYSTRISSPITRAQVTGGNAYSHASRGFVNSFQGTLKEEVNLFSDSLKVVWQVAISIVSLASLPPSHEGERKLREELDIKYGLTKKEYVKPVISKK
ncbi:hypothetical protein BJ875DRAFT_382348, partial [Amylocarpus encephaloides]